jgi:hypothetical protein
MGKGVFDGGQLNFSFPTKPAQTFSEVSFAFLYFPFILVFGGARAHYCKSLFEKDVF